MGKVEEPAGEEMLLNSLSLRKFGFIVKSECVLAQLVNKYVVVISDQSMITKFEINPKALNVQFQFSFKAHVDLTLQ